MGRARDVGAAGPDGSGGGPGSLAMDPQRAGRARRLRCPGRRVPGSGVKGRGRRTDRSVADELDVRRGVLDPPPGWPARRCRSRSRPGGRGPVPMIDVAAGVVLGRVILATIRGLARVALYRWTR